MEYEYFILVLLGVLFVFAGYFLLKEKKTKIYTDPFTGEERTYKPGKSARKQGIYYLRFKKIPLVGFKMRDGKYMIGVIGCDQEKATISKKRVK